MTRWGERRSSGRPTSRNARGQSVTEFAIVLPIILLLVLTVSDFGRFFATGITIESAARTAAELGAQEYVSEVGAGVTPKDYDLIHSIAWRSICAEAQALPNMTPASGGGQCDNVPTKVCVHDGTDPACDTIYNMTGTVSSNCPSIQSTPSNTVDVQSHAYVEVRVCYRFSTIFQVGIPFFSGSLTPLSGDFYIDRSRVFTIGDY